MNPLALFIGGIILGVLLSLSFIHRMKPGVAHDMSTLSATMPSLTDLSENLTANVLNYSEKQRPDKYLLDQALITKVVQPDLHTPVIQHQIPIVNKSGSDNPIQRLRWAPGKEGSLSDLKLATDRAQQLVSSATNEKLVSTAEDTSGFNGAVEDPNKVLRGKRKQKRNRPQKEVTQTDVFSTAQPIQQLEPAVSPDGVVALKREPVTYSSQKTPFATVTTGAQSSSQSNAVINSISPKQVPPAVWSGLNASAPRLSTVPNAFTPYHSQASRDYNTFRTYIPSLQQHTVSSSKDTKSSPAVPDMSKQKGVYEKDNLKLHLCNGVFEAYSASYLTTKQHMLNVASESYNLSWVNCEMASFIHMKESNKFYVNPQADGVIMQALDVLDFSVIHLSAFERSSRKYKDALWKDRAQNKVEWTKIEPVKLAGQRLAQLNNPALSTYRKINYSIEAQRTVVIMPFLGGAMGAGHSELGNRFEYLKTCFWSFYEFVPNIVAGVTRQEDVDWCMKESGLPFYDIILLPNLPKSAGLPVGTTQQTKLRLQDGRWDFDYVFFTESDQILISRELPLMYEHLKKYPGHMMLPHRLMPYSNRVISEIHKRNAAAIGENAWMNQSCCMPRQNCVERKTWLPIKDSRVAIVNYYGLYVPLGNVNFLDESFRSCKLGSYVGDYCP